MRKNTRIYIAALALFAAGLGFLIYTGLSEGSTYHLDVAEALSMPEKDLRNVRIFGILSPDKLDRAADSLGARFLLQDQHTPGTVMAVVYKGAVPDNFKPGTELYAEGSYVASAGVFQAGGLTTTCPSKYKKENRR
ncbi:putative cytochrome c-type biogenesis protein CcmE [uncultured delta proteobacterium]|uniref:Putative cytochrome c-type biogenesis protein CcmE n=1 Tax=uncultured delta proteobacterium TaxID=34034 RepID=A0A212J9Q8_9DELT|nr:putative cytochrome c-type biogenesis protein CcmE [uncultured delta proteobacterium]